MIRYITIYNKCIDNRKKYKKKLYLYYLNSAEKYRQCSNHIEQRIKDNYDISINSNFLTKCSLKRTLMPHQIYFIDKKIILNETDEEKKAYSIVNMYKTIINSINVHGIYNGNILKHKNEILQIFNEMNYIGVV